MTTSAKSGGVVRNRTRKQRDESKQRQAGRGRRTVARGSLGPSGLPLLRTSERGTFKRCHWKWWLEYHELVKPTIDVPPLRFGGLIHEALGAYYKPGVRRGPHPALTYEELYERDLTTAAGETKNYSKPEIDQIWSDHRDLGIEMMNAYIERYGKDDEWLVIATEFPFQTIVQHPIRKTPWFWYVGILDGIWQSRRTKRKVIPDHKTTKAIVLQGLQLDDQSTSYWTWGVDALINARILGPQEKIDGLLFNFLRKAKRDDRPQNADGYYCNKPKKQDYIQQLQAKRGFNPKWKLEMMAEFAARRNYVVLGEVSKVQPTALHARVPIYRDWYERDGARMRVIAEFYDMDDIRNHHARGDVGPDGIPPSAYKIADKMICAGCWALDICEMHEIGQDWNELKAMTTRTWDPYAAHEIREGR